MIRSPTNLSPSKSFRLAKPATLSRISDIDVVFTRRKPAAELKPSVDATTEEPELFVQGSCDLQLDTQRRAPARAHEYLRSRLGWLCVRLQPNDLDELLDDTLEDFRDMVANVPPLNRYVVARLVVELLVDKDPELEDEDFEDEELVEVEVDEGPIVLPVSEEAIAGLERVRVEDSEEECLFCLMDISVGSEAVRLRCSHPYHEKCILLWLSQSNSCPLCRFKIA